MIKSKISPFLYIAAEVACNVSKERSKLNLKFIKEKYAKSVPPFWSIAEAVDEEHCIVFHFTVFNKQEKEVSPFVERSIILNEDKSFRYFYCGKRIAVENSKLPSRFFKNMDLHTLLKKFQLAKVCDGLGEFKEKVSEINDTIEQDCSGKLRHRNCLLLSENKRCRVCERLRNTINQKLRRLQKEPSISVKP